jgi:hypothetical protein
MPTASSSDPSTGSGELISGVVEIEIWEAEKKRTLPGEIKHPA